MGAISSLGEDNCANNNSSNSSIAQEASGVWQGIWQGLTRCGRTERGLTGSKGAWPATATTSALTSSALTKAAPQARKLSKAGLSVRRLPCNEGRVKSGVYLNPPQEHGLSASESGFYINPG